MDRRCPRRLGVRHRLTAKTRDAADALFATATSTPATTLPPLSIPPHPRRLCRALVRPSRSRRQHQAAYFESYRYLYSTHIAPKLQSSNLRDLHRVHIKGLLAAKHQSGLSKSTVRLIRATLSVMLADAVDDGLLKTSPAALPSRRRGHKGSGAMSASDARKPCVPSARQNWRGFSAVLRTRFPAPRPYRHAARRSPRAQVVRPRLHPPQDPRRARYLRRPIGHDEYRLGPSVDMSRDLASGLTALYKLREAETLRRGWGDVPEWVFINRDANPWMTAASASSSPAR